jgi:DUF1009 family protein
MTNDKSSSNPRDSAKPATPRRVGLLAGWGRYPIVVAEALKRQGRETYCLGVAGHADPALAEVCDDFHYLGLAKFGTCLRYFHRQIGRAHV